MNLYGTSPVTRERRTQAELEAINERLVEYAGEHRPVTIRQLYYAGVVMGLYPKTEASYDLVCRETAKLRRAGRLPYHWIADNTRWQRKPRTYSGLEHLLQNTVQTYRRALWDESPHYIEVWLEKEALSGVLYEVTERWDVPLMVTKGFSSLSFLHNAAEAIRYRGGQGQATHIYYLGDYDPSGVEIPRKVEATLRDFAPDVELYFTRAAVNRNDIAFYNLPTRPTKASDSRSKNFGGESVELDALPPSTLRGLVEGLITRHIDRGQHERLMRVEESERQSLQTLIAGIKGERQ